MNVYVAAKFEETEKVRDAYTKLRAAGHTITHDWTNESANKAEPGKLDEYLAQCAELDLEGVAEADVLVIFPHERGKGLYVELGVALAASIPVICIADADEGHSCIFLKVDDVRHVETIEQAIALLARPLVSFYKRAS